MKGWMTSYVTMSYIFGDVSLWGTSDSLTNPYELIELHWGSSGCLPIYTMERIEADW